MPISFEVSVWLLHLDDVKNISVKNDGRQYSIFIKDVADVTIWKCGKIMAQ